MSDPTQLTYLDFDLAIEVVASASTSSASAPMYRARVLNSPAGQASVDFILPFNPYELENYILKIGRTRRTVRSLNSQEGQAARDFGERLYNAVFQGEVRDALRRSLDKADGQADHGLRIRLRLGDAPALLDLPWEYLYDPTLRRFFCHSTTTPLVRYPQQPRPVTPLTVTLPLQVLVLIANPSDVAALDVDGEWRKIESALGALRVRGLVQLTRLENGTLAALQRQLRQGRYHIFHFVGHGGLNGLTGERVLYLEEENGRARAVSGDHLGTLLSDHRSLRLVLLNACEGARAATNDPFAGIAQHLVLQGIPAIIAMQFEITDNAALILAQEFYAALADGYPVEAALAEARKAIFVAGNDVEWGTPVLYSRANDGMLFKVDAASARAAAAELEAAAEPARAEADDPPLDTNGLPTDLDDLVPIRAKTLLGYDFRIGKYPVTNHQFRRFIEAKGYSDNRWWLDQEGRKYRNEEKWREPRFWVVNRFNQPAQPVVGVSWYEASAYCAWLTAQWQAAGTIGDGEQARLPTQQEWIAAARGSQPVPFNIAEDYPWGTPFEPTRANTEESDLRQTTSVHQYPSGRTADGVWDMSGNVWEWTNDFDKSKRPFLKGGSWSTDPSQTTISTAYSTYRCRFRSESFGFRCVVVPISR